MKKRKVICQDCQKGRVEWGSDRKPILDGNLAAKVHASPSKARKCDGCGKKVCHFITDKHWSLERVGTNVC